MTMEIALSCSATAKVSSWEAVGRPFIARAWFSGQLLPGIASEHITQPIENRMATSAKVVLQPLSAEDGAVGRRWTLHWRRPGWLLILWLTLFPTGAWAGPPFLTDDPQTVDFQHWEFYLASIDFKTKDGWVGDGPHVEINYGVVPNVQLHLIAPVAYDSPSLGTGHYGYGDTELGVKFRFVQETKSVPMVGIFPLLEVPSGSAREGLGTGRVHALLPVWLQKTWGTWTIYGGGGYGINPGPGLQNYGFVGAVLQKQVLKPLLVGVEVYHQTAWWSARAATRPSTWGPSMTSAKRTTCFSPRAGPSMGRQTSSATSPTSGPSTTASSTLEGIPLSRRSQAEPMRMPTRNTSTPPTTTWKVALNSGVSM